MYIVCSVTTLIYYFTLTVLVNELALYFVMICLVFKKEKILTMSILEIFYVIMKNMMKCFSARHRDAYLLTKEVSDIFCLRFDSM